MDSENINKLNIKPNQKIKLIFDNNYTPTGYFVKNTEKNIEIMTEKNFRLFSRLNIIKNIELV